MAGSVMLALASALTQTPVKPRQVQNPPHPPARLALLSVRATLGSPSSLGVEVGRQAVKHMYCVFVPVAHVPQILLQRTCVLCRKELNDPSSLLIHLIPFQVRYSSWHSVSPSRPFLVDDTAGFHGGLG